MRSHPYFLGLKPIEVMVTRKPDHSVLSHEMGHLAGLDHCIHHRCLLNGANNLKEMDRQPLFLCPLRR